MSGDDVGVLYASVAILAFIVCFAIAVRAAMNDADGPGDLFALLLIGLIGAGMAGAAWPLTAFVGVIWAVVMSAKDKTKERAVVMSAKDKTKERAVVMSAKEKAEVWARVKERRARSAPRPETDAEKYRRMARDQRDLARVSRKQDMPDVAQLQDNLAEQYEALAAMYEGAKP